MAFEGAADWGDVTKRSGAFEPDTPFEPASNGFQPDGNGFATDASGFDNWGSGEKDAEDGLVGTGEAGGGSSCRNCGKNGHFARECPEPKKMSGECFNCGEIGHNKADCTNPRVDRPFTGTCRDCGKEGHRASDCPDKQPVICRICNQEGHRAAECTSGRFDFVPKGTPEMESSAAWAAMEAADKKRDLDEFKEYFWAYIAAVIRENMAAELDLADLEKGFRDDKWNIHLIAKERKLFATQTIVGINGKLEQKYVLAFGWTSDARSKKLAQGWPKSPEENIERLKSCGLVCESYIPVCSRCGEKGHIAKHCKIAADEGAVVTDSARVQIICYICNTAGHRARDCTNERVDPYACKNCKKSGHVAKECPEPRSAEGVECKRCGKTGHFARDCPDSEARPPLACRNCGGEGHMAKECDQPKNPANTKCRNCDEMGHFSKDCPKPRDYSKVQCKNCGEYGHTVVRCKKETAATGDDWGAGGADGGADTAASGGWENGGGPTVTENNDFGGDGNDAFDVAGAW